MPRARLCRDCSVLRLLPVKIVWGHEQIPPTALFPLSARIVGFCRERASEEVCAHDWSRTSTPLWGTGASGQRVYHSTTCAKMTDQVVNSVRIIPPFSAGVSACRSWQGPEGSAPGSTPHAIAVRGYPSRDGPAWSRTRLSSPDPSVLACALGETRTPDPLIRSEVLYPLSYEGMTPGGCRDALLE